MTIDDETLAEIRGAWKFEKNIACLARTFNVALSSLYKYSKLGFNRKITSRRALPEVVTKRRRLVSRLAMMSVLTNGGRLYRQFGSASQLVQELDRLHKHDNTSPTACKSTIIRDLHSLNLTSRKRRKLCSRELKDVEARKAFRLRMRGETGTRIIFSDETWISTKERTGDREWCRDGQFPNCTEDKSRRNLDSRQVFACVGHEFKSQLLIFPAARVETFEKQDRRFKVPTFTVRTTSKAYRLNADDYIEKCLEPMKEELLAHQKWLKKECGLVMLFQEDGASAHHAGIVADWFVDAKIKRLVEFPPYSPDLNMIELIWKLLHAAIGKRCPETEEELIAAALDAWEKDITQEVINAVVAHFQKAVREA